MTLSQLEYIVAVERVGSFTRAAGELRIAQPSLSMQVRKAEDEVGFVIFDRDRQPVVATDKGRRFVEQARVVLREQAKLMHLATADAGVPSGEFRLGLIPTLAPYMLPLFIEEFSRRYPRVRLLVDELKTETIIERLGNDELDAGILATPLRVEGLEELPLFYEPFSLYLSPGHALRERAKVSEADLRPDELWMLEDGHCLKNQIVNFCSLDRDVGVFKNINFSGGNLETLRYLIRRGRGYTLLPELFIGNLNESERRERVRPFARPAPAREVSLLFRRTEWKRDIIGALQTTIVDNLPASLPRKASAAIDVLDVKRRA